MPIPRYMYNSLGLGLGTCLSRLLGLLRDLSLAWLLGSSATADALSVALRLPFAWRRMFGEGTLTLALSSAGLGADRILKLCGQLTGVVAILALLMGLFGVLTLEMLVPGSMETQVGLENRPVSGTETILAAGLVSEMGTVAVAKNLSGAGAVATESPLVEPPLAESTLAEPPPEPPLAESPLAEPSPESPLAEPPPEPPLAAQILILLRLTLPYLVFLSLALGPLACLQSHNRFFYSSLTPTIFNLVILASLLLAMYLPTAWQQARLVAGAVVLGGAVQWLFLRSLWRASLVPAAILAPAGSVAAKAPDPTASALVTDVAGVTVTTLVAGIPDATLVTDATLASVATLAPAANLAENAKNIASVGLIPETLLSTDILAPVGSVKSAEAVGLGAKAFHNSVSGSLVVDKSLLIQNISVSKSFSILHLLGGILSAAMPQLAFLVVAQQASWLGTGSLSSLFYAERFLEFPLGLVGVLGLGSAPVLASLVKTQNFEVLRQELQSIVQGALLLALPATAGLAAIALPLVQLLYGHGAFFAYESTALALLGYSLGLPAYALSRPFLATYFALRQYIFPLISSGLSLGVVVLASNYLAQALPSQLSNYFELILPALGFRQGLGGDALVLLGLGLGVSLGLWVNALLLWWGLRQKLHLTLDYGFILWILGSSAGVFGLASFIQAANVLRLGLAIGVGGIVYGLCLWPWRQKIMAWRTWQVNQKDL